MGREPQHGSLPIDQLTAYRWYAQTVDKAPSCEGAFLVS